MKRITEIMSEVRQKAQVERPTEIRKIDLEWESVKADVNALSDLVPEVLRKYAVMNSKLIKESKANHTNGGRKCPDAKHYQVKIAPIHNLSTDLVVYDCSECNIFAAWYVVFDGKNNRCYKREIGAL